jgi:radical SAM protein (TIGR01212 family)
MTIREQMKRGIKWGLRRYKARKYMAYFQSWSNTFASPEKLRALYSEALEDERVVALAIGTRPDCVDRKRLDVIAEVAKDRMVWLEYGLQSASDKSLDMLNRGHTVEDFANAVKLTRTYGFMICAHIIFGIPGETRSDMLGTTDFLRQHAVNGVKFHQLFAVRGTRLHRMYQEKMFFPISFEDYVDVTAAAIRRLGGDTVVHRLSGDPPPGEIAVPEWSLDKRRIAAAIHDRLGKTP